MTGNLAIAFAFAFIGRVPVIFREIARRMSLDDLQNARLSALLNANRLEPMSPAVAWIKFLSLITSRTNSLPLSRAVFTPLRTPS